MENINQALDDLKKASAEIKANVDYYCGISRVKFETKRIKIFFLSPDGQCGELYYKLIAMGYKNDGYSAPYYWRVEKEKVLISYTEGDIYIYKR
ncbi:MAG: hypothetical protein WAV09_04295 [Minisyncoccia bacterium]